MNLKPGAVEELIDLVRQKFPGWESVADPAFIDYEIAYKRNAAAKVQELLAKQDLQDLLDSGQYDEVIGRFDQAGKAGVNLLYIATPSTGDLQLLYQDNVEGSVLAPALFDFIHGEGDQPDRLRRFLATSATQGWPQKWTFSTYFPYLLNPADEIFIKPEAAKWFLDSFADDATLPAKPDADSYAAIREVFRELREELTPYGARDMIDARSVMYVAYAQSQVLAAAITKLRQGLAELDNDPELPEVRDSRDEVIGRYQPIFAPDHLPTLTAEEFQSFLIYENNKHWKGINRYGSRMAKDMPLLRQALGVLLDETRSLAERYDEAVGLVSGLDRATATPILLVSNPDRYGVWNGKSEPGLQALKLYPDLPKGATPGQYYAAINNILNHLAAELGTDLWTLDAVWSWLVEEEKSLAPPFDAIFADREQAEWAFDLFAEAVEQVGGGPNDQRFSLTLPHDKTMMRLNFGNWTLVDITKQRGGLLELALLFEPMTARYDFGYWGRYTEDPSVGVFEIPLDVARQWPDDLAEIHSMSLPHIANHFRDRKVGLWRYAHHDEVFQALFDEQAREKLLTEGLTVKGPRYWRITLPSDRPAGTPDGQVSNTWEVCLKHGIAAIDFGTEADHPQVEKFAIIQPGDHVVAFLRNKRIGGIGTVTSPIDNDVAENKPADQDYFGGEMWYRIGVDWAPAEVNVDDLSNEAANKFGRQTVVEIDEDVFAEVLALIPTPPPPSTIARQFQGFTADAFAFLSELTENNNKTWMHANLHRWEGAVREPMRHLFADLGLHVKRTFDPYLAPDTLEIKSDALHTLARIRKNWSAKSGSEYYPYYWGAFYRTGRTKATDAHLHVNMFPHAIGVGFHMGENDAEIRQRFADRIRSNPAQFLALLNHLNLVIPSGSYSTNPTIDGGTLPERALDTLDPWLINGDFAILQRFVPDRAIALGPALADEVLAAFKRVFPIYLWAVAEDYETAIARYLEDTSPPGDDIVDVDPPPTPYTTNDFLDRTHLLRETLADLQAMIADRKQLIFSGPPGTGKTYVARELGKLLTGLADPPPERLEMIQFHPAYSYEDFIEGIRPTSTKNGDHTLIDYPTRAGVFRRFCERAQTIDGPCVFIIDEINRGNIARIFGELMLLLEYRDQDVPLPYSGKRFTIPPNVVLIGTMNTADRSIALVDMALRRRFHFFPFAADPELFGRWLDRHPPALPYLDRLYRAVVKAIDDDHYAIGPSYFMNEKLDEALLRRIWRYSILPQIEEYYFAQPGKAEEWAWEGQKVRTIRQGLDGD